MKFEPNPDQIKANQEQDNFDAQACSAEFSGGCIEPEEEK